MAYTTINKSTDNFNTVTFNGTGQSSVTGVGFTPDMFIHKNRGNTQSWGVIDVIRGNGNYLGTNSTNAQLSDVGNYGIATDGYTFSNNDQFYNSGSMVYWNWKAGGTVSNNNNNDGQGYSTVSANTTAGFSIVKYTGTGSNTNFGHGLGAVPKMIWIKDLSNTRDWFVYHEKVGNSKRLKLNESVSQGNSTVWNNTTPTSSVFYIDGSVYVNNSGSNYIAYCFTDVTGYSKFGSYSGNSNADGSFIYLGFKPSFIMVKRTDTGNSYDNWIIYDNKRSGYNVDNDRLHADISDAENTDNTIDIVSNGFKIRSNNSNLNGGTHIYMAIGQSLVGSNNVPATAR